VQGGNPIAVDPRPHAPPEAGDPAATEPRPASGALTKTGGFLCGFTHTLQPYIGCRFGCAYCYVQGLQVHRFHQPPLPWGDYVHPRTGIAEHLRRELQRHARAARLDQLAIFMSSATDPYQPAERTWRLSRACLAAMQEQRPGLLVVQTRSPLVREDFPLLRGLERSAWLSVTLETDDEAARRALTPACPSLAQRVALIEAAQAAGLQVQIAVSPCLPFAEVERFGALLLRLAGNKGRVVVDSYVTGDGQGGRRTAATPVPGLHRAHGWPEWRSEDQPRALFAWLRERIGARVGWSQEGFGALLALHMAGSASTDAPTVPPITGAA